MIGLLLIGPPGVGKGTQAARLREEFDLTHIATGDLLRDYRARGTELGIQASQYMSSGRLVPDDLVVAMVHERIAASPRFLLDGFPRTLAQAHALAQVLNLTGRELTAAIFVDAPDQVVIDRIAGRADGRDDDQPDIVRQRLEVFHRSTAPALAYYQQLGLLRRLDAARPVSDVYADARRLLTAVSGPVNQSSAAFAHAPTTLLYEEQPNRARAKAKDDRSNSQRQASILGSSRRLLGRPLAGPRPQ